MKAVSISGSLRENVGKKDAKRNRRDGRIPCVVYGGKEQIHFSVDEKAFGPLIFTPHTFSVNLDIDGRQLQAIIQEVQYHKVSDSVLHVDFFEINPAKPITLAIPVFFDGVSAGVLKGGKLIKKYRKVKVRALIENMPDEIRVDIAHLDILDSSKIGDLKIENLEFLDPKNSVMAFVKPTRATAEVAAAPAKK
ncbi:MAG: 50S ribosomal protein L25 [Bacteroidetes bacterium]|nr:50S ribosomal protein L25 [Bacteroidota bacterium]